MAIRVHMLNRAAALISGLVLSTVVYAHHSVPAEYGDSATPTHYIEGKIAKVLWVNPHIYIDIETTGGEEAAGESWRLTTHPINIVEDEYNFHKEEFKVGDTVRVQGWYHIKGFPLFHIRAIGVNDGPMRSMLAFADLRDIIDGTYADNGIQPAAHINTVSPGRIGKDAVVKLQEMGLIGADGTVELPEEMLKK